MFRIENTVFEHIVSNGNAGVISNEGDNDLVIRYCLFSYVECKYSGACGGSIYKDEGSLNCSHVCFVHSEGRAGNNKGGSVAILYNSLLVLKDCLCCFSSARTSSQATDSTFFLISQLGIEIDQTNFSHNNGYPSSGNAFIETMYGKDSLIENTDFVNCTGARFALFDQLSTHNYFKKCNIIDIICSVFFHSTSNNIYVESCAIFGCSKSKNYKTVFTRCKSDDDSICSPTDKSTMFENNNYNIICQNKMMQCFSSRLRSIHFLKSTLILFHAKLYD